MNIKIAFFATLFLVACSSSDENEEKDGPITKDTKEKTLEVQEANIELEQLDGELDSLLTTLN
ncbi:MAG: hypothetical protein HRT57_11625 [Crocinitomicaceae bacterium]|nr:hypothetical protein [Crocinitomicaceae bacterium]